MDISEYISETYTIFLFLLLTAGIFLVIYLFRIIIPLIAHGIFNINRLRKYFTIVEGVIWLVYLLTSAIFFLKHNIVFSVLLFLFLSLLFYWYSRFALRDFIAGLVFKSENQFSISDIIEVGDFTGEIKKFHYRNIEIETEKGKMILIPYSVLLGITGSPRNISDTVLTYSFEITIPAKLPFDKITEQLRKYIYSLPWATLKNESKIQLIEEIDNSYVVKITLFSFEEIYFQHMRKRVENYIQQNF